MESYPIGYNSGIIGPISLNVEYTATLKGSIYSENVSVLADKLTELFNFPF